MVEPLGQQRPRHPRQATGELVELVAPTSRSRITRNVHRSPSSSIARVIGQYCSVACQRPEGCSGGSFSEYEPARPPHAEFHDHHMGNSTTITDDAVSAPRRSGRPPSVREQHDRDATFVTEAYAEMTTCGYLRLAVPAEFAARRGHRQVLLAEEELAAGPARLRCPPRCTCTRRCCSGAAAGRGT
ncbi:hypothetical protein HBB16_14715 [Pseudonocardia sp. MCCB 268]|nr:hypothetical protein [Pseudonocardia cytotoxica]